jgi:hypothetical protein
MKIAQTQQLKEENMKQLPVNFNNGLGIRDLNTKGKGTVLKWKTLCCLVALFCLATASSADNGLIGKWRALDENNIIYGFAYIPEIKFTADGTLHAGITYGYRILDDSKFVWEIGHGIERIYKYEITGDLLMIYAIGASDDRTRFIRVR